MSSNVKLEIEITEPFARALELMREGKRHLFITGKAGTGKSTLLTHFIAEDEAKVVVLAPTGVAALNVKGETVHSFFRFMPNITLTQAIKKGRSQRDNELYTELKTLVIDEVSMVRADLMDAVDVFLRAARGNQQPFGGIQMILIGDLYQLPPVVTSEDRETFGKIYKSPWFFDSQVFIDAAFSMEFVELEKIYRQKNEQFIALLNAVRNKTISTQHLCALNERLMKTGDYDDPHAITLTSTNRRAQEINGDRLKALNGRAEHFTAEITGEFETKQFPTESTLSLKPKAQVMFVNNDLMGRWVNGTLGTVLKVNDSSVLVQIHEGSAVEVSPHTWDMYRYFYDAGSHSLNQEKLGAFTQIPLRLAWAVTIHKSQGKTFDRVIIDIDRGSFASGQTYVALSRCRTFEGIFLRRALKASDIRLDFRIQKFLTQYHYDISEKNMPLKAKIALIERAIEDGLELELLYLKAQDVKSSRRIKPRAVGDMDYEGHSFIGVEAFCLLRKEWRIFRVDKILEVKVAESMDRS